MQALQRLRLLLGIADEVNEDALLCTLLEEAEDAVLDCIGRDVLPKRLLSVVVRFAAILYNQRGAEGQTTHIEGGLHTNFSDSMPEEIKMRLAHYPKKVRVLPLEQKERECGS